jgi:uncharacterized membrane protein
VTVVLPATLQHATDAWASIYNDHTALRIGVVFCHLAGLVAGGGLAVAADRATLRVGERSETERAAHLDELHAVHRIVISGLTVTFASGILMLGADVETIAGSTVFWTKMALVALLIANGARMQRAERTARDAPSAGWPRLHRAAMVSLILWFAIVLAGTILTLDA